MSVIQHGTGGLHCTAEQQICSPLLQAVQKVWRSVNSSPTARALGLATGVADTIVAKSIVTSVANRILSEVCSKVRKNRRHYVEVN